MAKSTLSFLVILQLCIMMIDRAASACTLQGSLPEQVNCASYTNIGSESSSTLKGLFCQMILLAICQPDLTEDTEFNSIWRETMCTRPLTDMSSVSTLGTSITDLITRSSCHILQTVSQISNIRSLTSDTTSFSSLKNYRRIVG